MGTEGTPREVGSHAGLGPALEDAAEECLTALAGVDTYDTNMRDHPAAWAAIEAFAAKVQAQGRDCRTCRHHRGGPWKDGHACMSPIRCVDGSSRTELPQVQLWEARPIEPAPF